jgi:SH3-like domain-containing protein
MTVRTLATALACLAGAAVLAAPGLAAGDRFVRVRVDAANLRGGPGGGAKPLRLAYENEPLRVVDWRGPWLRVRDHRGRTGWIAARLTDGLPAVVVERPTVNVRSGPGTEHAVVFTAEQGVCFRVLDEAGDWLAVQHEDGDQGWLHESLVWGAR